MSLSSVIIAGDRPPLQTRSPPPPLFSLLMPPTPLQVLQNSTLSPTQVRHKSCWKSYKNAP
ncbi:MAG: hypothetical protein ACO331_15855 [Prochlorothrix sp.]